MGMIGNQIAAGQALTIANDSFNGDGSTTAFTLSQTVSSVNDIEVLVDNVQQSPYDSSYSVSGTTLTFSGAPSTGTNNVYVIYNASKHITTSQVIPDNGTITAAKLHSGLSVPDSNIAGMASSKLTGDIPYANMPAGSVIQVVSAEFTAAAASASSSPVNIVSVNITPKSSSSKIYITASVHASTASGSRAGVGLYKGSNPVVRGDAAGSRSRVYGQVQNGDTGIFSSVTMSYLDSPATTSQITYSAKMEPEGGSTQFYINRSASDTDAGARFRGVSAITVMEVAQ